MLECAYLALLTHAPQTSTFLHNIDAGLHLKGDEYIKFRENDGPIIKTGRQ